MVRLALVVVLAAAPRPGAGTVAEEGVCVVAHVSGESGPVDAELVRRIFLVRQRFWPDGQAAHPVNLPASSPLRETFSMAAFGQTVRDMAPYWNERYFHGTRPPPTMASEAAVLLFVARTPGGIGYVDESLVGALPEGVRSPLCFTAPPR
jgi:ABC-type phosphate transport system substrate-binding protein